LNFLRFSKKVIFIQFIYTKKSTLNAFPVEEISRFKLTKTIANITTFNTQDKNDKVENRVTESPKNLETKQK
jgi:hypothetical protein